MRTARAEDYRRRACQRAFPVTLLEFSFDQVPGLGAGLMRFQGAPAVICGGNGVGKTTILDALYLLLGGERSLLSEQRLQRLQGSVLKCKVSIDRAINEFSVRVTPEGVERDSNDTGFEVLFLDPGAQCNRWLRLMEDMANVEELLEPIEAAESDENELDEVNYLVGKSYISRKVYEIEEFDEPIPFVKVEVPEASYGFLEMGLGELCLNVLHWQLSNAPKNSVILIEEPESFVSPRSQRCLVDVLCRLAVVRGFFPVLTTHSWGVAGRLPIDKVTLIHGRPAGSKNIGILQPPRPHQLNDVLAVPHQQKLLILVEDSTAEQFARAIIEHTDPDFLVSFEIAQMGSATRIRYLLEHFPKTKIIFLVGLYDAGYDAEHNKPNWDHRFLPGENPPERELRLMTKDRSDSLAITTRRDEQDILAALAALEGVDDHDWLIELARCLGKEVPSLVDSLVRVWLQDTKNQQAATTFVGELRELID